ncbi:OmpA family protein [Promicromonospora sukumoe]|uniref:OmpA family protein n=1 Tax=Promicromonospora sukumoe TaxID=88382 RepID=UPI00036FF3C6|nr:OmpA family protein [Promicromonospora sukumoe]
MNMKVVLPPVIIVVLGLGAISGVQNTGFREHIESTLTESAQGALSAAGIDAVVAFSGRDADVTAPSDAVALEAADVVGGVTGVRTAAAYGPDGLVSADADTEPAEAEAAEPAAPAEEETEAAPEPTDEATATPEATEATSDGETEATEDDGAEEEDEPKREPTREEREEAQEDLVEIPNITFVTDSAELTEHGRKVVRKAAEVLAEHPEVEVRIEGHTDSVGTDEHNQDLSERRAEKVVDELVKQGVERDRLTWKGFGESDPLVVPRTFDDLEKNRRVEFDVTN